MALEKKEKEYLLKLARNAVKAHLAGGRKLDVQPKDVPSKKLTENGACFVTLHVGERLRGCIGSLEAHRPLVMDVIENALSSAFEDPRFYPMRQEELPEVTFSISVLSAPKPFPVKDAADLLKKLVPGKHGLIIQKGWNRATFLPVVWEQLPKKEEFLSHLCMKAGLGAEAWRDTKGMEFFVYEAEEFSE
ncbi:AmmeMemoRadiSam system protein A [Candidatus Micrarchaeota archaeon]|nr:AmmeMemoRadiSam system protein A [Candidatus Micrarchaeota archaeon]